jgi:hypothetical protein
VWSLVTSPNHGLSLLSSKLEAAHPHELRLSKKAGLALMKRAPLSFFSSRRSQLKQIQIFLEEVFFRAEAHSSIQFLTNSRESRIDRPPP